MSKRHPIHGLILAGLLVAPLAVHAADVKVQPAAGSGMVVTDSTGTQERLRVQESGPVYVPGLPALPSPTSAVCTNTATGLLGTCPPPPAPPPPPKSIVCQTASVSKICNLAAPCVEDFYLQATCPTGYTRLTIERCDRPLSPNLKAEVYFDPYLPGAIACHYTGTIDPFTTENLTINILCIEQICPT